MAERTAVNRLTEDRYLPGALDAALQDTVPSPAKREVGSSSLPRTDVFASYRKDGSIIVVR